jgi:uncharacterized protein (TIRG00374 family)
VRPHLVTIWANVKTIATEPRKIVYVLAGSTLAQLLVILALGASLHAVGQQASIATLITVNTVAALIGGAVPVPGGLGVVEAGLIAGLSAAGMPQDQAVAAVLIERFFTAYLPPVWGRATLAWMRAANTCDPAALTYAVRRRGAGRARVVRWSGRPWRARGSAPGHPGRPCAGVPLVQ